MSANLQVIQVAVQGYAQDGGLHPGEPLVISAEYRNGSEHASGPFHLEFVIDGYIQHSVEVQDLGPGESNWAQWQTEGLFEGVHVVRVGFAGVTHESEHVGEAYDQEFHITAAPVAPAAQDDRDEPLLASGYLIYELGILRHWYCALGEFDKVMTSDADEAAKPDFAGAVLKVFEEKVLGELTKVTHADLVIGSLKAIVEAAEKAKAASVSIALREFYSQHIHAISEMDTKLTDAQADDKLVNEVRGKTAQLLGTGKSDAYLAYRTELIALHDDAAARHQGATQDAFFDELSVEWMNQSVKDPKFDVALRVNILESDLSVLKFTVDGPDGDKLKGHLAKQQGGIDLWALPVPKEITVYEQDGGWPLCYVHVDRSNRLIELPAEQQVGPPGKYKEVFDRLHGQGQLIAHA